MRFRNRVLSVFLMSCGLLFLACPRKETSPPPPPTDTSQPPSAVSNSMKLFEEFDAKGKLTNDGSAVRELKVTPGTPQEADTYYTDVRKNLTDFPTATLQESRIGDMLVYYGFPFLLAKDVEALDSAVLMDYDKLRRAVTNPAEFEAAYKANPLRPGELVSSRFFAPKIINVRDPQTAGVPKDGFGWRKVVRFRARDGSKARTAGLDSFFLLFNFTTQVPKFPPAGTHAAQLQGILQPVYPTGGKHRDLYFLVYEALDSATPEKIGLFLKATFDLAGVVPDDKYYVPRSCGQCHGTEVNDQKAAKVNYLDTDHWIDRTGDDFTKVAAADVLVDGVPQAYTTFRLLNTEIEKQNTAVVGGGAQFALLATRKWLDLHKVGSADETKHVPPLRRGFFETAGDPVWTDGAIPDKDLLPLLNRYCFRCHSSVRFHVFQKKVVLQKKGSIIGRLQSTSSARMPQDRVLDATTIKTIVDLMNQLR